MMQDMTIADEQGEDDARSRRDALLLSLLAKRREAVSGRAASGIETEWLEDDEHYGGVDDANRQFQNSQHRSAAKRWATGRSNDEQRPNRSVIFLNITRPYVDSAAARCADMLLPTDDRAWAIKPTPIPKLPDQLVAQFGGREEAEALLEQIREEAKAKALLMQDEIDDCLVESNWHGEVRSVIEDAARIGSGVIKGPYPCKRTAKMYANGALNVVNEIKPATKRIDPWNFYPDPSCGESIHNGSYTWEREYVSAKQLRDMLDMPGSDRAEIIAALKEGAGKVTSEQSEIAYLPQGDQFELWIFHGECSAEDCSVMGVEHDEGVEKAPVMACIVNDRLVKMSMNVMDTGEFPYDVLAWQRRTGMPWGIGVARQIRTPQRMLNGAARAMMDNSGQTASPQQVIGNGVTPADGRWEIRGGKIWRAETDVEDVRKAFFAYTPPSVQQELMNIIEFALKMAEEVTGLPAMMQGQQGSAPDTVGVANIMQNNSSAVMRRLAKRFDDYITEPHIGRYYDWMMQHSENEGIKGDYQIDVRASSALVERDAQQYFLMNMAQLATNPAFGIDPAKLFAELAKGQRLDPKKFQFPQEVIEQMRSKSNPVEEAKAGLLTAQTEKTKAEAATKNVEGMFSATQAAQNIAMQPAIALPADQMWRSAGGEDKDAAPAIPAVAGPALPPETNTNPLTPTNPATGMNAGIEGGDDGAEMPDDMDADDAR